MFYLESLREILFLLGGKGGLGKQSWIQKIRENLCHFLGFGEGFMVCWGYFSGFLGLCSIILRYFKLFLRYFTLFYIILRYITLIFDSMTSYLTL